MNKNVSVVMATYNGEKYIASQLNSVINQTMPPLEIIISDDNSTDDTVNIVKNIISNFQLHKSDQEIRFILINNTERLGFRDNFLRASQHAKGDFIAFCDQDDIWLENKLSACSKFFDNKNISMIVHPAYTINQASEKIGIFSQGINGDKIRPPLSYDPWFTFWGFSIVFRRELLDIADLENRFVDFIQPTELIAHDRWIMFLAQMVGSTAEIGEFLVEYRQHENNVFGDGSKKKHMNGSLVEKTIIYQTATSKMIDIVNTISENAKDIFPLYQKNDCIKFLNNAKQQLTMRSDVYNSKNIYASIIKIIYGALKGKYNAVHDHRIRWRSIGRDIKFSVTGE